MSATKIANWAVMGAIMFSLTACGGGLFRGGGAPTDEPARPDSDGRAQNLDDPNRASFFDLFNTRDDPNVTLEVNKYLWNASLDVLNFMPVEAADPFTGTISMGYGTPQGGNRSYRATVFITDPALDARSLKVSLQSRNGRAVDRETVRAVEDAILTRARQLRIRDTKL